MTDSIAAPSWYPDPNERGTERWWDGQAWTERTRASVVAETPLHAQTNDDSANPAVPTAPAKLLQPGSGPTTAMLVLGILFFLGGWSLIGAAAGFSTSEYSDIVNIPSMITTSAGGLMSAALGVVLFGCALVRRHVAAWALWLRDSK